MGDAYPSSLQNRKFLCFLRSFLLIGDTNFTVLCMPEFAFFSAVIIGFSLFG